ncbi:MAG: FAD-containing oxidoreductase [Rhodovulum sulfidophilum]|uniref:FAD-containing oxidoreductase n=1 Tax=Rhodovulum sulfidophilum TaxID=35806 RepID=A0A2W5NAM6_RHOSU|nr:MAG: FAD-containing oxidoreductase [Rhodovulum sulfidophilum]
MTREPFDDVVIGAGQAGPSLAARLAGAGRKVALIERKFLGGTCVNYGCRPTKALIASARVAAMARRAADYGIAAGPVSADMAAVRARVAGIVAEGRDGLATWLAGVPGLTLIEGHARFTGPDAIRVGDRDLAAERVFLDVGARAALPDLPGIRDVPVLDNVGILELAELPGHLVVVGGGYIGLEFAQAFRRLGAEVTVVEKGPRLIGREDPEVSDAVRAILEAEGVRVRTHAACIRFSPRDTGVAVHVDCAEGAPEEIGTHVLVAMGRQPNTDDLGLATIGLSTDPRGVIPVDDRLATAVPGVWALGECNGRGAFTHTAYNDFEIVAANLLDGGDRKVTDRLPAYALFTDPPLGRAGMSEAEARASGRRVLVGRRPMTRVSRAVERGETQGFIKVLADADSREILGAAILGIEGDEAIHAVLDLIYAGAPVETLTRAVHIHPTVSELLPTVFQEMVPLEPAEPH